MDIIQLKIEKDNSVASYIKIIRKFDASLSVGTIKQRIDHGDFVVGFDLEYYDALEDINEIDRKKLFRQMIADLCHAGAKISIYQDDEEIPMDVLDNWLESLDIISRQVENDIDRETEIE